MRHNEVGAEQQLGFVVDVGAQLTLDSAIGGNGGDTVLVRPPGSVSAFYANQTHIPAANSEPVSRDGSVRLETMVTDEPVIVVGAESALVDQSESNRWKGACRWLGRMATRAVSGLRFSNALEATISSTDEKYYPIEDTDTTGNPREQQGGRHRPREDVKTDDPPILPDSSPELTPESEVVPQINYFAKKPTSRRDYRVYGRLHSMALNKSGTTVASLQHKLKLEDQIRRTGGLSAQPNLSALEAESSKRSRLSLRRVLGATVLTASIVTLGNGSYHTDGHDAALSAALQSSQAVNHPSNSDVWHTPAASQQEAQPAPAAPAPENVPQSNDPASIIIDKQIQPGDTPWDVLNRQNIDPNNIMPTLSAAAGRAAARGVAIEVHGSGAKVWYSTEGNSDTSSVLRALAPLPRL